MKTRSVTFLNAAGQQIAARIEYPLDQKPKASAIFAHCFTCGKDFVPTRNISRALTQVGYAVMRFDFTGHGMSEGAFAATNFSHNIQDLLAAYRFLEETLEAPSLLVGHSLGGTAVLAAALELPKVKAVATIGSPAEPIHVAHLFDESLEEIKANGKATVSLGGRPFVIEKQFLDDLQEHDLPNRLPELARRGTGIMILHSPQDTLVEIENARTLYNAAKHPKSFISLDGADHLLLRSEDSAYAGSMIANWSTRYIHLTAQNELTTHRQVVAQTVGGGLTTEIRTGKHGLLADEPIAVGGEDLGPSPYELLMSALGACTGMTLQLYASRKKWDLKSVEVHLAYGKVHAEDAEETCAGVEPKTDRIVRELILEGELDASQRQRLLEIANKCPVHRTLERGVVIETQMSPKATPAP